MKKKRFLIGLALASGVLALASCTDKEDSTTTQGTTETTQTSTTTPSTGSTETTVTPTTDASTTEAPTTTPEVVLTQLYLRGDMNSWGATDECKLVINEETKTAEITAVISKDQKFKIADADWTEGTNFGVSAITNEGLFVEDSGNAKAVKSGEYKFVVTYGDTITIVATLVREIEDAAQTEISTQYYVRGEMNEWGTSEESKLVISEDKLTAEVTISIEAGKAFKIADADWKKEYNLSSIVDTDSLLADASGNVTVKETGTYKFVVSLSEGSEICTVSKVETQPIERKAELIPTDKNVVGQTVQNMKDEEQNYASDLSLDESKFEVHAYKGDSSGAPSNYSQLRIYNHASNGGKVVISCKDGANILTAKITFTNYTTNASKVTVNGEALDYTKGTTLEVEVNALELVIQNNNASGQIRIDKIEFTYGEPAPEMTPAEQAAGVEAVIKDKVVLEASYLTEAEVSLPTTIAKYTKTTIAWTLKEGSQGATIEDGKLKITPTSTEQKFTLVATATIEGVEAPVVVEYAEATAFRPAPVTHAEYISAVEGSKVVIEATYVYSSSKGHNYFVDSTGKAYMVYDYDLNKSIEKGNSYVIVGEKDIHNGTQQLKNPTVVSSSESTDVTPTNITETISDYVEITDEKQSLYVTFAATIVEVNEDKKNVTVSVGDVQIKLYSQVALATVPAVGDTVTVTGFTAVYNTTSQIAIHEVDHLVVVTE